MKKIHTLIQFHINLDLNNITQFTFKKRNNKNKKNDNNNNNLIVSNFKF